MGAKVRRCAVQSEKLNAVGSSGGGESAARKSQEGDSSSRSSCSTGEAGEQPALRRSKERGKDDRQAEIGRERERRSKEPLSSCGSSEKSKTERVGPRDDNIPRLEDEKFLGSEEAAIRAGLWCDSLEKDPRQVPLEGYAEDKSGLISMGEISQAAREREYVSVQNSIRRCGQKHLKNVCEDTSKYVANDDDDDGADIDAEQNVPSSDKGNRGHQNIRTKSGEAVPSSSYRDCPDRAQRRSKEALGCVMENSVHSKGDNEIGDCNDKEDRNENASWKEADKVPQTSAVAKTEEKKHTRRKSSSPRQKRAAKHVPNPRRRVKVYRLNEDGCWDDCITGHVRCETRLSADGKRKTLFLVVVSEHSGLISLEYSVKGLHEAFYQLQGSTIITWTEENSNGFRDSGSSTPCEMALSFAEESGCKEVWDEIRRAQARSVACDSAHAQRRQAINQANALSIRGGPLFDDELEISSGAGVNWRTGSGNLDDSPYCDSSFGLSSGALEMYTDTVLTTSVSDCTVPEPEYSQLASLAGMFTSQSPLQIPTVREKAATEMMSKNYVGRLLEVFRRCEDFQDITALHQLFIIFRGFFLMGSLSLLEVLLSDLHFLEVVNTLEYDPEYFSDPGEDEKEKAKMRARIPLRRYRGALEENPAFRSVVEINDKATLGKIHQNYRIGFIKDVILARSIDDITYSMLQSLIQYNNVDIVKYFLSDKAPLESLFSQIRLHGKNCGRIQGKGLKSQSNLANSQKSSPNSLNDLLRFVVEFLSLSRYLQPEERNALHSTMGSLGILGVVQLSMRSPASSTRLLGTQVLLELAKWEYSLAVLRISMTQGFPGRGVQPRPKIAKFRAVTAESIRDECERRSNASSKSDKDSQGSNCVDSRFDASKMVLESKPDQSSSTGATERGCAVLREKATESVTEGAVESEHVEDFQDNGVQLLEALFDIVCNDNDSGVVLQAIEIIRRISNPETMTSTSETTFEKEKFLNVLYSHLVPKLFALLKRGLTGSSVREEESCLSEGDSRVSQICDLLSYFITAHGYRIKYLILGEDVIATVLGYLKHSASFVRLAALRVLRTAVGTQDDFYDRYIIRNQLLGPVISLFVENNYKDNLVNSAVLELIEFCAKERRRALLLHLVEKHACALEPSMKHSSAFEKAKQCLKHLEANELSSHSLIKDHRINEKRARAVSADEDIKIAADQDEDEDYFEDSDMTDMLVDKPLDIVPSRRRSLMLRSAPFPRQSVKKHDDEPSGDEDPDVNPSGAQTSRLVRVNSSGAAEVSPKEDHKGKFSIDSRRDPRGAVESPFPSVLPRECESSGDRNSQPTKDSESASCRKSFCRSGPDHGGDASSSVGDRRRQEVLEEGTPSSETPKATRVARDDGTEVDARAVEATLKRRRLMEHTSDAF